MPPPEPATVAGGDLPSGQHRILQAGRLEQAAVGTAPCLRVSYLAALLPRTTGLPSLTPLDPADHPLAP